MQTPAEHFTIPTFFHKKFDQYHLLPPAKFLNDLS